MAGLEAPPSRPEGQVGEAPDSVIVGKAFIKVFLQTSSSGYKVKEEYLRLSDSGCLKG